ncbi:hypothetical protein LINPERPRIM_LOCUS38451 [Linum perenne]
MQGLVRRFLRRLHLSQRRNLSIPHHPMEDQSPSLIFPSSLQVFRKPRGSIPPRHHRFLQFPSN